MTEQGWVAPAVAAEFPRAGSLASAVPGSTAHAPAAARAIPARSTAERALRSLHGGHAVHMRERPIPWAYRVFFRQIGLDPDRTRTPVEALALERMKSGGFKSRNQLDDALTIATIETGVALRAFDADEDRGRAGHPRLGARRGARGAPRCCRRERW